jgi:hypothetical protein
MSHTVTRIFESSRPDDFPLFLKLSCVAEAKEFSECTGGPTLDCGHFLILSLVTEGLIGVYENKSLTAGERPLSWISSFPFQCFANQVDFG